MSTLPYKARTATGDVFDIDFPLHEETGDPVRVAQMIGAFLSAIDKDIAVMGEASNGDVLQALAMTLAIRTRMIHAPEEVKRRRTADLVAAAMDAAHRAERSAPDFGNA